MSSLDSRLFVFCFFGRRTTARVKMAAWATPKQAPKPQMRAIIAEEREVAGDDELREALAASRREADQLAARIVDAETAEPAGGPAADASLALALALQDEEERGAAARESARIAAAIRAARRHEKVRVGRVPEGLDAPWSTSPPEDTVDDVAAALAAEGVSTRGVLGGDIVGRRADGSLVSKHDVLLDGRLKASLLSARVAGAGDLSDQRVPARAYHDLVAFQHRQESRGDRGGS